MSEPTYELLDGGRAIRCRHCGLTSHNPTDVAERYCGHCHLFHDAPASMLFELVWMQRLGGGSEVLRRGIPSADALAVLQQADREDHGPGGVVLLRPDGETGAIEQAEQLVKERDTLFREITRLEGRRDAAFIRIGELEAMSAALRAAAKTAATLLFNLNQRGRLGLDVHEAIDQTLTPLDAALATGAGAALLAERTDLRARVDTLEAIMRGAGEQLGQGDIPLAVAIARLHVAHADAWKLIGRCDMALEMIEMSKSIQGARSLARAIHAEIKKASGT
jgi:hypothetical protein